MIIYYVKQKTKNVNHIITLKVPKMVFFEQKIYLNVVKIRKVAEKLS